ncbi:hypothetical protein [Ruegeria sp. HKCCD8929]|uniref:hypothetical protein n=1 Tax=Ruegeria sp. HKCCD8929 TaxID=2683006 RepID=UPI00148878C9|nr:hypothetical protein [Ruegeria sp. HKCCD8929]
MFFEYSLFSYENSKQDRVNSLDGDDAIRLINQLKEIVGRRHVLTWARRTKRFQKGFRLRGENRAACARSENLEFTGWARSLNPLRFV